MSEACRTGCTIARTRHRPGRSGHWTEQLHRRDVVFSVVFGPRALVFKHSICGCRITGSNSRITLDSDADASHNRLLDRSAQWNLAMVFEMNHPFSSDSVGQFMIGGALTAFRSNKDWADKAITQTSDENLRRSLDPNTNSIAVIMKHVAGNLMSRWTDFLTSDGEKPWRHRDDEFKDSFGSRNELLACWESGWQRLFETLESLTVDDMTKIVTIRGEAHSVPLAISRSLAHCGYHVGQIVLIARILAGDQWTTITIPRGGSGQFNANVWGSGHYQIPSAPTKDA